jgi:hypothetical protein
MGKSTTEDYLSIDIRKWERKGVLSGSTWGWRWMNGETTVAAIRVEAHLSHVVLRYRCRSRQPSGEWETIEDRISLDWTSAFGRERPWFLCPDCDRRVAILYFDKYFRCRRCLQLVYRSQQVSPLDRPWNRIQRNRIKLGGSLAGPFPPKPQYMRWKEYFRLMEEDKKVLSQYLEESSAILSRIVALATPRK